MVKINGIELTPKQYLNRLRKQKRELEKEIRTEAVHNELKFLYNQIHRISTTLKIERLEEKQKTVRNAKIFWKISEQIDKLTQELKQRHKI